jgi:hypothetical protein
MRGSIGDWRRGREAANQNSAWEQMTELRRSYINKSLFFKCLSWKVGGEGGIRAESRDANAARAVALEAHSSRQRRAEGEEVWRRGWDSFPSFPRPSTI